MPLLKREGFNIGFLGSLGGSLIALFAILTVIYLIIYAVSMVFTSNKDKRSNVATNVALACWFVFNIGYGFNAGLF